MVIPGFCVKFVNFVFLKIILKFLIFQTDKNMVTLTPRRGATEKK
jgi:hypothetical protein